MYLKVVELHIYNIIIKLLISIYLNMGSRRRVDQLIDGLTNKIDEHTN